jgi:hypothetical protein
MVAMPLNDLDLMRLEMATGFTYDERGRMLLSNEPREPDRTPARRVCLGRTTAGHGVRFRADVPDDVAEQIAEIVTREPTDGDLRAPPVGSAAIEAALTRHAPIVERSGGPAYHFPASIPPLGDTVRITAETRDLVRGTFPWLYAEYADWWPAFVVLHGDVGVSACFSARIGALMMAAGVFTLEAHRGHGYAAIATAAWAAAVRATGRIPVYGTSWDNLASQGVARRLGLIMHGSTFSWT